MQPLIECCEQNLVNGTQLIIDDLFIQNNSDVVTYTCMSECKLCSQLFYILFEGEKISAKTPEELKKKITDKILDWQQEMLC